VDEIYLSSLLGSRYRKKEGLVGGAGAAAYIYASLLDARAHKRHILTLWYWFVYYSITGFNVRDIWRMCVLI
jgi:hypothetical protein